MSPRRPHPACWPGKLFDRSVDSGQWVVDRGLSLITSSLLQPFLTLPQTTCKPREILARNVLQIKQLLVNLWESIGCQGNLSRNRMAG